MKTKRQIFASATIFILVTSLASALAQSPAFDPNTGLPLKQTMPAPVLDPNTGLPLAQAIPEPQWISDTWVDPDILLTNVVYDGLPLSEVANQLRASFKNQFDILAMPKTFGINWGNTIIQLQLRNVRASDIFKAMNMVFENDHTPLRWQLMNDNHPMVILRVLPDAAPEPSPKTETHRMVYFVGNLIGDGKSGGMTVDQLIDTILKSWPADFGKSDGVIQFHKDAQLLIVNGTREQNEFVQQMLSALQQKAEWDRSQRSPTGSNSKINDLKGELKSSNDRRN
jgi:hypothetical protein